MSILPIAGFVLVALLALAFAAVPVWRMKESKTRRALLLAAIAVFLLGVGGGTYWMVGRPLLAQREAEGMATRDMNALVPYLIKHVRANPKDARAWRYLGQIYMSAGDPGNAARALARAIEIEGKKDPALNAAYGEALVMQSGGTVNAQAEAAFAATLKLDPSSAPGRYYMGLARLQKGDRPGAVTYWQSLVNDLPPTSQLYQTLVDRLAALTATGGAPGGAPDPRQMVASLAARLKANPDDALGWVRLMRAYTVLGETDKAKEALASARKAFASSKEAQTAFTTAAKELKIE